MTVVILILLCGITLNTKTNVTTLKNTTLNGVRLGHNQDYTTRTKLQFEEQMNELNGQIMEFTATNKVLRRKIEHSKIAISQLKQTVEKLDERVKQAIATQRIKQISIQQKERTKMLKRSQTRYTIFSY